jgi:hypothetical protein
VYASTTRLEIMAVDFGVEDGRPRISLPRSITRMPQPVTVMACTADHGRYLVGLGNAVSSLPPVKVLAGWGPVQGR